jgi:hypothetical protein
MTTKAQSKNKIKADSVRVLPRHLGLEERSAGGVAISERRDPNLENRTLEETANFDSFEISGEAALRLLGGRLSERIGVAGTATVSHPAQTRHLQLLSRPELEKFAETHRLHVVRRIGGRAFDFTRRAEDPRRRGVWFISTEEGIA